MNLNVLITMIQKEVSQNPINYVNIKKYMSYYDTSLLDWKKYEFFDEHKNYTRNLIATDHKNYTLLLLCWNPHKSSPIHDHSGVQCHLRVISGKLHETLYDWPEEKTEEMKLKKEIVLQPNEVSFINDTIGLHKVSNPYDEMAISLHLYTPPYDSCNCFTEKNNEKMKTNITYYSEYGKLKNE